MMLCKAAGCGCCSPDTVHFQSDAIRLHGSLTLQAILVGKSREGCLQIPSLEACMLAALRCLQATLVALGATKRPLPGFSDREPGEEELEVAGEGQ
jgi:hypothetical protein